MMNDQPFIVYPAIDLRGGKVVRLLQGRADQQTVYADDPVAVARQWEDQGARYLHVVDLDGAFEGGPRNWDAVDRILNAVQIPLQLGGGLRSREDIEQILARGVTRVVLGTRACESPDFVGELVGSFGARIVVGIDARDGFVAVKGWTEKTELTAAAFARQVETLGVRNIIFTDVATDGMLQGPNLNAVESLCNTLHGDCHIIASGGVSSLDDVRALQALANKLADGALTGVIVGKALYDGRVRFSDLADG